jgi:hypothetical protein
MKKKSAYCLIVCICRSETLGKYWIAGSAFTILQLYIYVIATGESDSFMLHILGYRDVAGRIDSGSATGRN